MARKIMVSKESLPSVIFDGIIEKYLDAYPDSNKRQLAEKDIQANLIYWFGNHKNILSLYNVISCVHFGPSKGKLKNAIIEIMTYDTHGCLWQNTVNFYRLHCFIGDDAMIAYMDKHHLRVSVDAFMNWMRAVFLNGVYSFDRKIMVSPLSHKALYLLHSRRDEASLMVTSHKIYFLENLLYGGHLDSDDYNKIFGNIDKMPSSMSYAGALLRICGWTQRYDVLEEAIIEAKRRFTVRPINTDHYYSPVYKSLSDMMYIRSKVIRIQRTWRAHSQTSFKRKLVMTMYKVKADPKVAYIMCTHLFSRRNVKAI